MIGMVKIVTDTRPHCCNGWVRTARQPGCGWAGAHFCERLANHKGRCRCTCGSVTRLKPDRKE